MPGRKQLRVVTIGNPSSGRIVAFQGALERAGQPTSAVVSYLDLIQDRVALDRTMREGDLLRIESPGQEFEVEKQLIALGARVDDEPGASRIGCEEALQLPFDKGRIWFPRQWFLGFRKLLRGIDRQRAACPEHLAMNPPSEIEVMFDKPRCHGLLTKLGVSCPPTLGLVRSYDELRQRMRETRISRVFVKLAHASSASGVVALAIGPRNVVAYTTAEVIHELGEVRLYNSRSIRRIEDEREVAVLVDTLAREGVQVERWVPKASIDGFVFDLRVVVIAGKARHVVVRSGRGPLTNLHLKNQRDDPSKLRAVMPRGEWDAAMNEAERASSAFPNSLHAGVDLLIAPGYRRRSILEVNAFGDLLHGVSDRGLSTHDAEIEELLGGWAA
jgi:glutathione synthase/RimK-type ligase-like ATP-grasp enzyme